MIKSIQVRCLKDNLKKVRTFVDDVLQKHYISATEINLMVLAVDELCANLIIHSHDCNPNEQIEVSIEKKEDNFIFEIKDTSPPDFRHSEYQTPDVRQIINQRRSGGLGLILVNKIVDEIKFERQGVQNVCRFHKKCK